MGILIEENLQSPVLHLDGEATIAMAAELKNTLIQSLSQSERLTVNLEAVVDMDISCLQLLCAANRHSEKNDKTMQLYTGANEETLRNFLLESGYDPGGSCPESPCKRCLWKGDRR